MSSSASLDAYSSIPKGREMHRKHKPCEVVRIINSFFDLPLLLNLTRCCLISLKLFQFPSLRIFIVLYDSYFPLQILSMNIWLNTYAMKVSSFKWTAFFGFDAFHLKITNLYKFIEVNLLEHLPTSIVTINFYFYNALRGKFPSGKSIELWAWCVFVDAPYWGDGRKRWGGQHFQSHRKSNLM